jgi:hypothetical protein
METSHVSAARPQAGEEEPTIEELLDERDRLLSEIDQLRAEVLKLRDDDGGAG